MARGSKRKKKTKRSGGANPAPKKGKRQKYGLREAKPVRRKAGARKKVVAKKKAARRRPPNTANAGSSPILTELAWDENYAHAAELHSEDHDSWWDGIEDPSFNAWVKTQRYNYKAGVLRPDREQRLRKIDFVWEVSGARWNLRYGQLKNYIQAEGEMWWRSLPADDADLEAWCAAQRRARAGGQLKHGREELLDAIGFTWRALDATWSLRLDELREALVRSRCGHVTREHASVQLLQWIRLQRRKRAKGELPPEHQRRLDEVGFRWDGREAKSDAIWHRHVEKLLALNRQFGNPNPGPDDDEGTFRWLQEQRKKWDLLPEKRRRLLVELGVSSTTPPGQVVTRKSRRGFTPNWEKFLHDAAQFKERFGHLRIASDAQSAEFPGLLNFASKIRSGKLEPDPAQRAELERMGFVWDLAAARVDEFFDRRWTELVAYKEENGDCNVSQISKTHRALGQWVHRMRLTRAELPPRQRERLDEIGFVWELKKQWMGEQWEKRFAELLEYKRQHGDCLVPQSSQHWPTLCRWVSRMRATRGELGAERVKRLDDVGFVWNAKEAERAQVEEQRVAELLAFIGQHGHARVTRGNDPTGGVLNRWIVRQREKKKAGKMDEGVEKRLDELGFVWVTR